MCNSIQLAGVGKELLALEALKKKLQAEGLFAESRKRSIVRFPRAIGIIVGKGSAAEADLLKNLNRRWPLADLYFFPSLVQGKEAPKDLLRALSLAQSYPLDTLIIARGGGSNEDLSAFNDEALVRSIASSRIPTISAVGHESDTTLVDYVSDLRVSTPTGAAEAATPNVSDVIVTILDEEARLHNALNGQLRHLQEKLALLSGRPFFKNPAAPYEEKEEEVEDLSHRLSLAMYATGLRVSELVGLKLSDVSSVNHVITIIGKGNKQRSVPISDFALDYLEKYLRGPRARNPGHERNLDQLIRFPRRLRRFDSERIPLGRNARSFSL